MLSWGYIVPAALLVCVGAVYAASTNEEERPAWQNEAIHECRKP